MMELDRAQLPSHQSLPPRAAGGALSDCWLVFPLFLVASCLCSVERPEKMEGAFQKWSEIEENDKEHLHSASAHVLQRRLDTEEAERRESLFAIKSLRSLYSMILICEPFPQDLEIPTDPVKNVGPVHRSSLLRTRQHFDFPRHSNSIYFQIHFPRLLTDQAADSGLGSTQSILPITRVFQLSVYISTLIYRETHRKWRVGIKTWRSVPQLPTQPGLSDVQTDDPWFTD